MAEPFDTTFESDLTFLGIPERRHPANSQAQIGIIGVPMVTSYSRPGVSGAGAEHIVPAGDANPGAAPGAIRRSSQSFRKYQGCYDFDLGATLQLDQGDWLCDFGDVSRPGINDAAFSRRSTAAVRGLLDHGIVPVVLGGDHATTIPVVRAYEGREPMCLVQVDAHMDFRDEISGMREGYGSPIRRSAELDCVVSMAQIGVRGWGAARKGDVEDALAAGSAIFTAEEVHDQGMESVLPKIPAAEAYYITLDIDGLDPSIAPGVLFPSHGGLTYYQTAKLLRGITRKGRVAGMDVVEVTPGLDTGGRTSILAVRLILDLLGFLLQSGQVAAS
jgi:agmatinase